MAASFGAGSVISGRYHVTGELGRGGMATVYVADDETHGRRVAIKVLAPEVARAVGPDRFLEEIRITAHLGHPNILPLIDSGKLEDIPYYITPLVEGRSLRDRLQADGPLGVEESLALGKALAEALAHAHAHDVVHRDLKPANVLLDESGNPYLADFGIARAFTRRGQRVRTSSGLILGTPAYMSPEQISEDSEVDGRSDVYGLACLVYEALAGGPPFTASSDRALLMAHLTRPPPSIRAARPDVPPGVDSLLRQAMAKEPADRIQTAAELGRRFDQELTASKLTHLPGSRHHGAADTSASHAASQPTRWAVVSVLLVAAVGMAVVGGAPDLFSGPALDTTRYALLPFEVESGDEVPGLEEGLRDALAGWAGVEVAERTGRVRGEPPAAPQEWDQARGYAERVEAGRVVMGRTRAVGDSVHLHASVRDPMDEGRVLRRVDVAFAATDLDARMDSILQVAAERVLFDDDVLVWGGTRSVAARRHFASAWAALQDWNLLDAEESLTRAIEEDPYFSLALVWRAQTRSWQGNHSREWETDARRAAGDPEDLPPRERVLARALAAMSQDRHPEACAAYEELLDRDPDDFAALFGLGDCRRWDTAVQRDPSSPSGWSFRGSSHAAAQAYQQAFEALPTSYRAFGAGSFDLVQSILFAQPLLRQGRGPPPESRVFLGVREWRGDSLAIIPVPADSIATFDVDEEARAEAAARQQRMLLDVANTWVRAFPGSSDALHTLALARELARDPAALETYRRARVMTRDPVRSLSIGVAEVILQVRLALPDRRDLLDGAVALADSLLTVAPSAEGETALALVQLSMLLGHPTQAAQLVRRSPSESGLGDSPVEMNREATALIAFAAIGRPGDSVRALSRRLESQITQMVPAEERALTRQFFLELPSLLAFPLDTLDYLRSPGPQPSPEARAMAALAAGESDTVLEVLGPPPPAARFDIVLARGNILLALGRSQDALDLLRSRLDGLDTSDPVATSGTARVGALVRAAALRARLEAEVGEMATARQWAQAVLTLWSSGEPSVEDVRTRLLEIVDSPRTP